jgi:hypothetical protein
MECAFYGYLPTRNCTRALKMEKEVKYYHEDNPRVSPSIIVEEWECRIQGDIQIGTKIPAQSTLSTIELFADRLYLMDNYTIHTIKYEIIVFGAFGCGIPL